MKNNLKSHVGGLGNKKKSKVFSMMVGQFSNGGLGNKGIEYLLSDGGLV